jgi:hypothetical protein
MLFVSAFVKQRRAVIKRHVGGAAMDDYQEELLESHEVEQDGQQWDEDATEL